MYRIRSYLLCSIGRKTQQKPHPVNEIGVMTCHSLKSTSINFFVFSNQLGFGISGFKLKFHAVTGSHRHSSKKGEWEKIFRTMRADLRIPLQNTIHNSTHCIQYIPLRSIGGGERNYSTNQILLPHRCTVFQGTINILLGLHWVIIIHFYVPLSSPIIGCYSSMIYVRGFIVCYKIKK